MDVPCYITVHNLLTWTAALVADCRRLGLRPVVCDHGSTYRPLLDWYETDPCEVRRYENHGPHGFFNRNEPAKQTGPYVHTDCDLDLSGVPADALDKLLAALDANPWATKAGLSLETVDVPDDLPWAKEVKGWEAGHWVARAPDGNWIAGIDGTFALYDNARRNLKDPAVNFYRAVRLDRPYTARHLPWYLTREQAVLPEFAGYFGAPDGLCHWSPRIGRAYDLVPEPKKEEAP